MKRNNVSVGSLIVWGTSVERLRRILLLWMIYISMVRFHSPILNAFTHPYALALGISDEVEKLGLKGSKKKKSKKLDEDYAPILKPLQEKDVPKVIQAIRQTSSRKVLLKLLTRIKVN